MRPPRAAAPAAGHRYARRAAPVPRAPDGAATADIQMSRRWRPARRAHPDASTPEARVARTEAQIEATFHLQVRTMQPATVRASTNHREPRLALPHPAANRRDRRIAVWNPALHPKRRRQPVLRRGALWKTHLHTMERG